MKADEKNAIYHENRKRVYEAIVNDRFLDELVLECTLPFVGFLDMQSIFRHCPLKDFYMLHGRYKNHSEALFDRREQFLKEDPGRIMDAVLRYYRRKQSTRELSVLSSLSEEKRRVNVLWILVTQKNMKSGTEPIVDVVALSPTVVVVSVGCFFYAPEFTNCSQSVYLKNEMDDYAMLLLATRFLDASMMLSSCTTAPPPLRHRPEKWYRKKRDQQLLIFSNDNFTRKESVVKLQHHAEKVSFYKFHGP